MTVIIKNRIIVFSFQNRKKVRELIENFKTDQIEAFGQEKSFKNKK